MSDLTLGQLDALPEGAIVEDRDGDWWVLTKRTEDGCVWLCPAADPIHGSHVLLSVAPLTLVREGTAR